ncbi:MAG: HEAT repeat domain-containing protein [Ignavibacteriales bacterium]|nr:HEAT repeat domain-containing protein [Ignavibacteriales bacterium]
MRHKKFQEMILLSFYGELNPGDQGKLDRHLSTCEHCRLELQELTVFHKTLASYIPISVRERDVVDARRSLRVALGGSEPEENWVQKLIDAVTIPFFPQYRAVLVSAATFAVGIGLGYYFFGTSSSTQSGLFRSVAETDQAVFDQGDAQITNFRIVSKNEATGGVEFEFDATTPVRVKGNVKTDERVQKILARAAVSAENPGTRLRVVSEIAEHASSQHPVTKDVKAALISVVQYDENRGVRQEALKALEKFLPDPDVVQAYVHVLRSERNTGMKIQAINGLSRARLTSETMSEELLKVLREKVESDENNYVKIRAKATLEEVRQQ